MKIPKDVQMMAGTALGLMIFMVVTVLGYIFGDELKQVNGGGSTAVNNSVTTITAIFATITGLLTIVVLWQIARIVIKGFGAK